MKKSFITGLIILLPSIVTIWLMLLIFNLVTKPFAGSIQHFLTSTNLFGYADNQMLIIHFLSRVIVFFLLLGLTVVVGFFARMVFIRWLGRIGEFLIARIPVVNKIYHATREVVSTIVGDNNRAENLKKVVLIAYPSSESWCLGFVTNDVFAIHAEQTKGQEEMIPVFLPGCPNPTMGFLLMCKKDEVRFLDFSAEEALHMIISLGIVWKEP